MKISVCCKYCGWINCCNVLVQAGEDSDFGDEESDVEKDLELESDNENWFMSFLTSFWIAFLNDVV